MLKYLQHVVTANTLWDTRFGKENWNEECFISSEAMCLDG